MKRLAVVGAGMMGEALARGLLAAGWSPSDIVMADVRADRLDEIAGSLAVETTSEPAHACAQAQCALLAVKPQDARAALEEIRASIGPSGLLSIVAGMRTSAIEQLLADDASVVRAMPNTPARVGKGVTALSPGAATVDASRELAEAVFASVGPVVWLEEDLLDAVTALSGSGPAYVFLLAESLISAGVDIGLSQEVASTLVAATIEGAGVMLRETGDRPEVLRKQVTSPGGTTEAALQVLDSHDVRGAFERAVRAAHERSRELGR